MKKNTEGIEKTMFTKTYTKKPELATSQTSKPATVLEGYIEDENLTDRRRLDYNEG